jgi:flagellar biosynthetic protein FliQ
VSYDLAVELVRQSVIHALLLAAPVLAVTLAIGLTVSVLQTVTQIQEQTVAFTLKLFAAGAVLFVTLPWMISLSVEFASRVTRSIPTMVP